MKVFDFFFFSGFVCISYKQIGINKHHHTGSEFYVIFFKAYVRTDSLQRLNSDLSSIRYKSTWKTNKSFEKNGWQSITIQNWKHVKSMKRHHVKNLDSCRDIFFAIVTLHSFLAKYANCKMLLFNQMTSIAIYFKKFHYFLRMPEIASFFSYKHMKVGKFNMICEILCDEIFSGLQNINFNEFLK